MALTTVKGSVIEIASQAEAEAGAVADKFMTPERTAQALVAQAPASAQIMTFNGDTQQTITPNVVDGIYRISGMLYGSSSYVQTSDDGGVNYTDTSGDIALTFFRFVYGNTANTIQSGNSLTSPGFLLDAQAGTTAADTFNTFQAILAFNGVGRISMVSTGTDFNSSGNMNNSNVGSTTVGNHDSGINRIRIVPGSGTLTGTVIVENLRLS